MRYFKKYQQNLKHDNNFVYSYDTKVAEISYAEGKGEYLEAFKNGYYGTLKKLAWNVDGKTSSPTTTRHINHAADQLNLLIVE
tara:strand:+ start:72 stop:320 length:249 start_codon:yes stop_codon:yes gene_type:complete